MRPLPAGGPGLRADSLEPLFAYYITIVHNNNYNSHNDNKKSKNKY